MATYKLLKKYPSLPNDWEVGMEVETTVTNTSYYHIRSEKCSGKSMPIKEVEDNPEFWEYQPEFKILKLTRGDIYEVSESGKVPIDSITVIDIEQALNTGFKIYSVQRTSDGVEFNLGDMAKTGWKKEGSTHEIVNFKLAKKVGSGRTPYGKDLLWVDWDNDEGGNWIEEIQHCEPLFTTEDGVDMYEGDFYYIVYTTRNYELGNNLASPENKVIEGSPQKTFHSLYNALEYIDLNIPKYSLLEISDLLNAYEIFSISQNDILRDLDNLKIKQNKAKI